MKTNGNHNGSNGRHIAEFIGNDAVLMDYPEYDLMGENHVSTSIETPIREDAFLLTDDDKLEIIEGHFRQIMLALGLDMSDDSLRGTPRRVSKLFVKEIFNGLNPENRPAISVFENKFKYDQMLVEKNISVKSTCEHHFLPITGKAHVAYISTGKIIGLSKINRIVDHYARRPQVQERLTVQIANDLKNILNTEDVAVVIEANHACVSSRGIEDDSSTTLTATYLGRFNDENYKQEFLTYLQMNLSK